jgi:hypothetical protein
MLMLGGNTDLKMFHVQSYNDAIAEMQRESRNGVLGQMLLPALV